MKKNYFIAISLLGLAGIFLLLKQGKTQCDYPVFDLKYKDQVLSACFQASSLIHHQHKNSLMVEIVSPSALVEDETIFFPNEREMALFACQIVFKSQNRNPTRNDTIARSPLPAQKIIKAQDNSLFASDSGHSLIIDRLFCVADK